MNISSGAGSMEGRRATGREGVGAAAGIPDDVVNACC